MKVNTVLLGLILVIVSAMAIDQFFGRNGDAGESSKKATAKIESNVNKTDPFENNSFEKNQDPFAEPTSDPNQPKTTISFKKVDHDFGTIKEGEIVNHTFAFTNAGKEPLIVSNAKGSCGCTVPRWPKEPIAPGETGEIEVSFNSKGKTGNKTNTVTLTANTEPINTRLTIKANVLKEEPTAAN